MRKIFFLLFLSFAIQAVNAQNDDGIKTKLNGFGDVIFGGIFGNTVDKHAADLFSKYGNPEYPTGMHNGFTSHGVDLLGTVWLKHDIKFQTELNAEGSRGADGGEFDLEIERLYFDYSLSEKLGFQVGYIFTPIGYINRNLYSRAWLMNSIRFYQAIEPAAGFIPNHFLGATAYGKFAGDNGNALSYMIGYGKARDISPQNENTQNDEPGYQTDALLEWLHTGESSELRLGLSGFTNEIHTYNVPDFGQVVDIHDSDASKMMLQENGFNPYLLYKCKAFDFLAEYDLVQMHVRNGDYPQKDTYLNALSAELAINCKVDKRRLAPYVRYDFIFFNNDMGPYYGLLKLSDDELTKSYVPQFNAVMTGIAYDISANNRTKIEYTHHFDGPFKANGVFVQTAFGF